MKSYRGVAWCLLSIHEHLVRDPGRQHLLLERLGFQFRNLLFGALAEGRFELVVDPVGGKQIQTLLLGGKGQVVLPTSSVTVCEAVLRV
jgi:hypothetical protein